MSNYRFIEDLFLDFYQASLSGSIRLDHNEDAVASNFYFIILENRQFTAKQAAYLLKILKKHSASSLTAGLDYAAMLENPEWKNDFRVIDNTKSVSVEKIDEILWLILKLPFALKEKLDAILNDHSSQRYSRWDHERQVRKIELYQCNVVLLNDFFVENNFFRDESFINVLSTVEEIWQRQDSVLPRCKVEKEKIELINPTESAREWWEENKTDDVYKDMFLAKSMGYYLDLEGALPQVDIEKLCSSPSSSFRFRDLNAFFTLYKKINGSIAVILNKDDDALSWTKKFTEVASTFIEKDKIKICFRLDKNSNEDFNQWIKDQGFGGKVDGGKIFIFQGKPAKWVFTQNYNIDIILSNTLYPIPSSTTQDWMGSHHCKCYIGEYKASQSKDENIVDM